jgi:hypothetical protein
MRTLFSFVVMVLALAAAAAANDEQKGEGKKHEYTPDKLPKLVKVKAGESIVVTHNINPADVEEIKSKSDNADVTVQGKAVNGVVQITIRCDKKGKAKVGWEIVKITGRVDGRKELQVEFE